MLKVMALRGSYIIYDQHHVLPYTCHFLIKKVPATICFYTFFHFATIKNERKKKELFLLIVKEKKKGIKIKESVNSEFIMSFLHD